MVKGSAYNSHFDSDCLIVLSKEIKKPVIFVSLDYCHVEYISLIPRGISDVIFSVTTIVSESFPERSQPQESVPLSFNLQLVGGPFGTGPGTLKAGNDENWAMLTDESQVHIGQNIEFG